MSSKCSVAVVVALVICMCSGAFATDIFVATNGNDANPGTIDQPLATLRAGTNLAVAGDNIYLRAGTYVQHDYWDVGGNGAPGQYITIQAYDGDRTAVLQGDVGNVDALCFYQRQYAKVIGLEISGGACAVHVDSSQHIYVQRGHVHDPGNDDCVKVNQCDYIYVEGNEISRPAPRGGGYYQECIDFVDVDFSAMRDNYCHDFGDMALYSKGGSEDTVIERNVISSEQVATDNPATGFGQQTDRNRMDGATYQSYNCVYRNNIIRDANRGAIGTYDCYHGYFYNNVAHNCGTAASDTPIVHQRTSTQKVTPQTTGVYFFNNVFLDTRGQMPTVYKYLSGTYSDWQTGNNNYYNNGLPIPSAGIVDPNTESGATFGSPNLANPTGTATTWQGWVNCYRITASSAALIDHGTSNAGNSPYPAVTADIEGVSRPQGGGWDIGCSEYPSGPPAPTANFTGNPTSGAAPLAVAFTDTSTGNPTSWSWTFGDSGTSTAQSPSHTYSSANSYTVSLTATNAAGSDTETKTNYITAVQAQDYTCASLTVNTGTLKSGDHTSVHSSDNVYLVIGSAKVGNKQTAQVSYTYNTGLGSLSYLTATVESKVSAGTQPLTVYAYNYSTSSWTSIATGTLTTTDSTVNPTVSNPSQYISGGTVQVRVKAGGSGSTAFDHSTDLVKITAAP
jgi:PKD repeat protein